jgi:hypothetical protein
MLTYPRAELPCPPVALAASACSADARNQRQNRL